MGIKTELHRADPARDQCLLGRIDHADRDIRAALQQIIDSIACHKFDRQLGILTPDGDQHGRQMNRSTGPWISALAGKPDMMVHTCSIDGLIGFDSKGVDPDLADVEPGLLQPLGKISVAIG